MATCVYFLGEGVATDVERQELLQFAEVAKTAGLKSCLYSGRDVDVETWMLAFDYVKVGSYIEECIAMGNNMLTCIINPNIKSKIENKLIEKNYKIIETNDCGKIIVLTKRKKRNQVKKIVKNFDENSILIIEKVLFD